MQKLSSISNIRKLSLFDPNYHKKKLNFIQEDNLEDDDKKKDEDKYSFMLETYMKIKMEEENIKKEFLLKCERCLKFYEREEFMEFIKMIKEDEKVMNKIYEDKGENFRKLVLFEENLINYFLKELEDKNGYTKIKNPNFQNKIQ